MSSIMSLEIEQGFDGLYSIAVFHASNTSDDEFRKVFGKFGNIMKLNRSNDIVFLRYQTLEEATLCYESMKDHPKFTVRPGRRKGASNNGGRNNELQGTEMNRNDNFRGRRSDGSGDFKQPNPTTSLKPPLIPFPAVPPEQEITQSPPMAPIVVMSNLHPKMGQNHIYDLCKKANGPPLHVAMKILKRPPYPNISYAYVYVKTDVEAQNIITAFNNLSLNGYHMNVALADKLSEHGKVLLSKK